MRRTAWHLAAIVLLGGILAMPAIAQEPAVVFDGDGPLTVTPGGKASLTLLNNTGNDLMVSFQVVDEQGADSTALTLAAERASVRAGGVTAVAATASNEPEPAKGFVVAVATRAGAGGGPAQVARRAFAIQADASVLELEPLVNKWSVTSYRGVVIVPSLHNETIPLRGSTTCPADAKPVEAGGVASEAGGAATVAATCTTEGGEATPGATLSFDGLGSSGDYSGTIDLLSDDDAKGTVDLTVRRTDFILWPALALAVGIGLAIWVAAWVGRGNLLSEDEEATWRLLDEAEKAEETFRARGGNNPWSGYTYLPDFRSEVEGIIVGIRGLQRELSQIEEDDERRNELLERQEELAKLAAAWPDVATRLSELSAALQAAEEAASQAPDPANQGRPAFLTWAARLLYGKSLGIDEALRQAEEIESAATMAEVWPTQLRYVDELTRRADGSAVPWPTYRAPARTGRRSRAPSNSFPRRGRSCGRRRTRTS
jgi:hypothetical protein